MPLLSGLISSTESDRESSPIPLKSVNIHADVRGWAVAVTAELTYENILDHAIESIFVFPLADSAAVYHLAAVIDDRKIVAEGKPRSEARMAYKDAVAFGFTCALAENEVGSGDVFRVVLGNLPSNKAAKVTIGYVQPVDYCHDGVLSVVLPAVLHPRYIPQDEMDNVEMLKQLFHLNTPYISLSERRYSMSFNANVQLGDRCVITEIVPTNPRDNLKTTFDNQQLIANIELEGNFSQNHDFGFRVVPAKPWHPVTCIELGCAPSSLSDKNWLSCDVVAARFEPETVMEKSLSDGVCGGEYWLVIDRSGSMWGSKIENAKAALLLFIKSLPMGCKFNIVGFGSKFTYLFPQSVEYTDETVATAVEHSRTLKADLEGTEILKPLQYIYNNPLRTSTGARRFIILLTDGAVRNTEAVIGLAMQNASSSQVFCIGIGDGASTALVNGLARVSGGVSTFVRNAEDSLQEKTISLLKATTNPAADNIKVEWNLSSGRVVSLLPEHVPRAAFPGQPIIQYALIERGACNSVQGTAKFTACVNGKTVEHHSNIEIGSELFSPIDDPLPLHRLAAKMYIQELSDKTLNERPVEVLKNLSSVSVATGILCNETALVAVDKTSEKQLETFYRGRVFQGKRLNKPVHSNSGHDDNDVKLHGGLLLNSSRIDELLERSESLSANSEQFYKTANSSFFGNIGQRLSRWFASRNGSSVSANRSLPNVKTDDNNADDDLGICCSTPFETLFVLQKANGSWELTEDLVEKDGKKIFEIRAICMECLSSVLPNYQLPDDQSGDIIATLFAIAILRSKFGDINAQWSMIEQKALSFIVKATGFSAFQISKTVDLIRGSSKF